jgi:NTP pyrophosphatase (non-canonical NTP hydrolase)
VIKDDESFLAYAAKKLFGESAEVLRELTVTEGSNTVRVILESAGHIGDVLERFGKIARSKDPVYRPVEDKGIRDNVQLALSKLSKTQRAVSGGPEQRLHAGAVIKDPGKLKKELGGLVWYVTAMADVAGFTLQDLIDANAEELIKRHGDPRETKPEVPSKSVGKKASKTTKKTVTE